MMANGWILRREMGERRDSGGRGTRVGSDASNAHPLMLQVLANPPSAKRGHRTSVGLATTSLPLSRDRGPPRIMMTKNVGERCVDDFLSSTMYCSGFGKFGFCCGWRAIGIVLDTSTRTEPVRITGR